ncbi:hypothetical protein EDB84DRAFT_1436274 [Lactarius hengduanensis]|nr:hypothetical protein EDB84DRAFT_1436274 [Lactarius hengduanensis]
MLRTLWYLLSPQESTLCQCLIQLFESFEAARFDGQGDATQNRKPVVVTVIRNIMAAKIGGPVPEVAYCRGKGQVLTIKCYAYSSGLRTLERKSKAQEIHIASSTWLHSNLARGYARANEDRRPRRQTTVGEACTLVGEQEWYRLTRVLSLLVPVRCAGSGHPLPSPKPWSYFSLAKADDFPARNSRYHESVIETFGGVAARKTILSTGRIGRAWAANYAIADHISSSSPSLTRDSSDDPLPANFTAMRLRAPPSHAMHSFVHGGTVYNYHLTIPTHTPGYHQAHPQ